MNFEDLMREDSYEPFEAYGQSKLANLLFTLELDKRLAQVGASTLAVAAHPGISQSNLMSATYFNSFVKGLSSLLMPFFTQPASKGALPQLYAATAAGVSGGEYFGPQGRRQHRGYPQRVPMPSHALNEALQERLWEESQELTGVSYLDPQRI